MRVPAVIGFSVGLLGTIAVAHACPGNPDAMGTSRVLKIDPREYPRLGTMQYQDTLPLNDREVVLTFDDGPMPPYTNRVLESLAQECIKANYFVVGRMARGYPELLRRIHDEGHVIGTHSENHPLAFEKMPLRAVQTEIDQGFASTRSVLRNADAVAPFFRIPGLLRGDTVENYLRSRGMVTWSADVVGDDWKHITASEVVTRTLARLDARGKGIVLLHDIQPATALALPHLLRELKRRGYRIVQVAPATAPNTTPAVVASAPAAAGPVPRATPDPAPAPPEMIQEAAAANASPAPAAADAGPEPTSRPPPPPIMDFVRTVPAVPHALVPEQPADAQPVNRPLTPGFKLSHSDSLSMKVSDMPIERQQADPWAMRAEQQPAPKQPWPIPAWGLTQPERP